MAVIVVTTEGTAGRVPRMESTVTKDIIIVHLRAGYYIKEVFNRFYRDPDISDYVDAQAKEQEEELEKEKYLYGISTEESKYIKELIFTKENTKDIYRKRVPYYRKNTVSKSGWLGRKGRVLKKGK